MTTRRRIRLAMYDLDERREVQVGQIRLQSAESQNGIEVHMRNNRAGRVEQIISRRKFIGGVAVVNRQGTADAKHTGLFPHLGSDAAGHGMLKSGDTLAAAALLCQADGSIRGQS